MIGRLPDSRALSLRRQPLPISSQRGNIKQVMVNGRFFRAVVLAGGAVALGCGGAAAQDGHRDGDASDASSGGTAAAGSGGATASGGSSAGGVEDSGHPMNSGGAMTAGGAGGATNTGGAAGNPMTGCAQAQWECHSNAETPCADFGMGVNVPLSCACDPARPVSALDCKSDEVFVCRVMTAPVPPGGPNPPVVAIPFECSCRTAPATCEVCSQVFGPASGGKYACTAGPDGGLGGVLCGCVR